MPPFKPFTTGLEKLYHPFRPVADVLADGAVDDIAGRPEAVANFFGRPSPVSVRTDGLGIEPGFNLADSFGSGLIASGGIKLFGQALSELFGKKKKEEKPKTFEELYRENLAATPKRESYLEAALKKYG